MKSLIITWENFQDQELVYPYYRLREEAKTVEDVKIISNVYGNFYGIMGVNMTSNATIEIFNNDDQEKLIDDHDILILPGGVKALEKLRQERNVINFISRWNAANKIIASTCHGAQLLISAKVTKGKKISGYYSLKDDIENSGAEYVDLPVVVDGNIITSPHYKWMGEWMSTAIREVRKFKK